MKKRSILLLGLCAALVFSGCKKEEEAAAPAAPAPQIEVVNSTPAISIEDNAEEEVVDDGSHEGMYRSELTNEWISEDLKDQRPIAAMVDNEKTALPHFGLSHADVVYEMTNSLANDGITRLIVLVKDF